MSIHKLRTTLRSDEMRVYNDQLTLVRVSTTERKRIGYKKIRRLPSGEFCIQSYATSRHWHPVTILGTVNLLEESIENEQDEREGDQESTTPSSS